MPLMRLIPWGRTSGNIWIGKKQNKTKGELESARIDCQAEGWDEQWKGSLLPFNYPADYLQLILYGCMSVCGGRGTCFA